MTGIISINLQDSRIIGNGVVTHIFKKQMHRIMKKQSFLINNFKLLKNFNLLKEV